MHVRKSPTCIPARLKKEIELRIHSFMSDRQEDFLMAEDYIKHSKRVIPSDDPVAENIHRKALEYWKDILPAAKRDVEMGEEMLALLQAIPSCD